MKTNHHKWQITFVIIAVLQIATNMVFVVFLKVDLQEWNFYGDEKEHLDTEMCIIKDGNIIIKNKPAET